MFDRAKSRDVARNEESKTNWLFERAKARRDAESTGGAAFEGGNHDRKGAPEKRKDFERSRRAAYEETERYRKKHFSQFSGNCKDDDDCHSWEKEGKRSKDKKVTGHKRDEDYYSRKTRENRFAESYNAR